MLRFAIVLAFAFSLITAAGATAGNKRVQPQPLNHSFEKLVLLNAKSSNLRLFIPAQTVASPLKIQQWELQLETYCQKWLAKKEERPDRLFIKEFFFDVHQRYLKHYTPYAGMQALLTNGEYNCLSATALYALLFHRLGYDYTIIESVNHIVIVVNLGQETILLETTDPENGFISDKQALEQRLADMKKQQQSSGYYNLGLSIFRTIDIRELAGLQFFNYAAWYYNQRDLPKAASQLEKGQLLYKSERFNKVARLITSR